MTEITRLVRSSAVEMVENTIDQARQGHYQAMRYLFEMAGLFPVSQETRSEGDSLAKTLLGHLAVLEQEATGETPEDGNPSGNRPDAVR